MYFEPFLYLLPDVCEMSGTDFLSIRPPGSEVPKGCNLTSGRYRQTIKFNLIENTIMSNSTISRNSVDVIGFVGSARVSTLEGGSKVANFSVAVDYAYTTKDGTRVVRTNWIPCTAWAGKYITNLDNVQKGVKVHVRGRLESSAFVTASGEERSALSVHCTSLSIVVRDEADDDLPEDAE